MKVDSDLINGGPAPEYCESCRSLVSSDSGPCKFLPRTVKMRCKSKYVHGCLPGSTWVFKQSSQCENKVLRNKVIMLEHENRILTRKLESKESINE